MLCMNIYPVYHVLRWQKEDPDVYNTWSYFAIKHEFPSYQDIW